MSIEPRIINVFDPEIYETRVARYEKLRRSFANFTAVDFTKVVEEVSVCHLHARVKFADEYKAAELLGIKTPGDNSETAEPATNGVRNFNKDVLKIEISGPSRSYFSILDVPGIFQSVTGDLTQKEMKGVKRMVEQFMMPQQSVLMYSQSEEAICDIQLIDHSFVASAASDLATQGALDLVTQHDRSGERTVGVVTKCDLSQIPSQVRLP